MKQQHVQEIQTKLQNIKASRPTSRFSGSSSAFNQNTIVAEPTTGESAPPATRLRGHESAGMVELKPARTAFPTDRPELDLESSYGGSSSQVRWAEPSPRTSPWQPAAAPSPFPIPAVMTAPPAISHSLEQRINEVVERLQLHAERINQLSADQETALQEFQKIAEGAERDLRAIARESGVSVELDSLLQWTDIASQVLRIDRSGSRSFVITAKPLELRREHYDAEMNAETVRRLQSRVGRVKHQSGVSQELSQAVSLAQLIWRRVTGLMGDRSASRVRRTGVKGSQARAAVAVPKLSIQSSLMWVVGAIFVRRGLDLMLASNPSLWPLAIAIIAAPAMMALYRATVAPQAGFALGVNLFLVMIGLLIGGRF